MALVRISSNELLELKEFFKVDWPLHIVTYNTIKNFVNRFEKFPEWKEKVKFWSLNGEWRTNGTFVMVNGHLIFFNTLESEPFIEIKKALMLISYSKFMLFMDIRNIFGPMVHDVIKSLQLEVKSEIIINCYIMPRELYLNFDVIPPDGFKIRPLTRDYAAMINEAWPNKNEKSEEFLGNLIEFNVNFGLFNEKDELIAWNLSYDSGAMGIGQVVEHERRKNYARFVFAEVAKTIATNFKSEIYYWVRQGNTIPEEIMRKMNVEIYDVHRWIGVGNQNAIESARSHL